MKIFLSILLILCVATFSYADNYLFDGVNISPMVKCGERSVFSDGHKSYVIKEARNLNNDFMIQWMYSPTVPEEYQYWAVVFSKYTEMNGDEVWIAIVRHQEEDFDKLDQKVIDENYTVTECDVYDQTL